MEAYTGEIRMFAGLYVPEGWLACDGSTVQINQYQALFSLIGTTYGGDGRATFVLPDLRGRLPVSQGQGPTLTYRTLGQIGGSETITLTETHMAAHTHTVNASLGNATSGAPAVANQPAMMLAVASDHTVQYVAATTAPLTIMNADLGSVSVTGANQSHNNVMPSMAINFIIWPQPSIYPTRA